MTAALSIIAAALVAAPSGETPLTLSMWAIQASSETREEKYFDAALAPVRKTLEDLPFNTFRCLQASHVKAPQSEEARLPIDKKHTLFVTPLSRDEDGRIRLDIRVERAPKRRGGKPVKLVSSRLVVTPEKPVKIRGLHLDEGELVIVLAAKP